MNLNLEIDNQGNKMGKEKLLGLGKLILGTIITTTLLTASAILPDLIENYSANSFNKINNNPVCNSERLLAIKYK